MSALTLTLRRRLVRHVDLAPITPDRLDGKALEEIEGIPLTSGNQKFSLTDLFELSGSETATLVIRRSSEKLVGIGTGMSAGSIEVYGRAGDYLGRDLRGGSVRVRGHVGDGAAMGMRGGCVEITGDAGHYLGAAEFGAPEGMSEGIVMIGGRAGDRIGDRMRRGIIVIEGDAGDYIGSRMRGGTIVVMGRTGQCPGLGMRRGTIVLGRRPASLSATFNSSGLLKMEFLRLLFRQLSSTYRRLSFLRSFGPEAERLMGDFAYGGKGEVLLLQNAR